ncbi:MAG TPA: dihydrofolate reductase family protein [Bryobacteraceae bacterium]|jgi:dihydrofolate reductase
MRKVILGLGMSLDGYIARADGSIDYLAMDKESQKLMDEFFQTVDVAIMGRKTMEGSIKMSGGRYDSGGLETFVFSRTWKPGARDGFEVVNGSLASLIRRIRKKKGKHIYLGGGGELARSFLQADLVDEMFIGIGPVLLGEGIPAFPGGFPQRDFSLRKCTTVSNGGIALIYSRHRTRAKRPSPSRKASRRASRA